MSEETKTETREKGQPPVAKVRVGLISASIWERKNETGTFYNVTFERRYRDAEGNYQSTHGYGPADLLGLAKAADLAHTKIMELRADESE